jgi:hypothetical protein
MTDIRTSGRLDPNGHIQPTETRCERTELLVDQCGCPDHRGGTTPEEQLHAHRAQLLLRPAWMAAQWPGVCERCGTRFPTGAAIAMEAGLGWRAECCS